MIHKELTWNTDDGIQLFGQYWKPDDEKIKAVICLVHGFGEHSSRYVHVADFFTKNNYALLAFDLRGHGKSKGPRGHASSYDALLNDVDVLLAKADTLFPNCKKILYGHSMGGGIVANFILRRKSTIEGAILSSPFFKTAFEPPKIKIMAGKFFENLLPTLSLPSGLDVSAISRDQKVVDKYSKDPLVHGKISAKMGMILIDNGQWALDNASKLSTPVLMFHGTADQLTSFAASESFAQNAGDKIKFVPYEGLFNETHNEPDKATVLAEMLQFCNSIL